MTKVFVFLEGGAQKIAVARTFYNQSPVHIFDEPSSALDPIAEARLFDNIIDDRIDKTTVFISHRLSSVKKADYVYFLEKGNILEEGTHDSLMKKKGKYYEMYRLQAKNYILMDE